MKLNELHFTNFRLFKKLDLLELKRINLITGKNNTGKTALLEGIRILAAKGESTVVNHVLNNRGEFTPSWDSSYQALFYQEPNNSIDNAPNFLLTINDLSIQYQDPVYGPNDSKFGIKINGRKGPDLNSKVDPGFPNDKFVVYLPYKDFRNQLHKLWDNINLTNQEEEVLTILQETILPSLKKIGFIKKQFRVLLNNQNDPIPIGQLGDGVYRMLGIALALANAQNKILLIDELELGLHHSLQKSLWGLIFKYTKKWNIQAFITTHSEDILRNFYYVGSIDQNKEDANFIRLQYNRKDTLEAISYDMERLEKVINLDLEIR